jgi:hypothetical protein
MTLRVVFLLGSSFCHDDDDDGGGGGGGGGDDVFAAL